MMHRPRSSRTPSNKSIAGIFKSAATLSTSIARVVKEGRKSLSFFLGLCLGSILTHGYYVHFRPLETPSIQLEGAYLKTGFSPDGRAEENILNFIDQARDSIHLSAYSFTSERVADALCKAARRGVCVKCVIDYRDDRLEGKALSKAVYSLLDAKIEVVGCSKYAIHHDKFIVVDRMHVETGSFNYSYNAAHRNSENCLVLYNVPEVAKLYLKHWESRYAKSFPLRV